MPGEAEELCKINEAKYHSGSLVRLSSERMIICSWLPNKTGWTKGACSLWLGQNVQLKKKEVFEMIKREILVFIEGLLTVQDLIG